MEPMRTDEIDESEDAATTQYTHAEMDRLLGRAQISLDDRFAGPPVPFALDAPPLRTLERNLPDPAPVWPSVAAGMALGLVLFLVLAAACWLALG